MWLICISNVEVSRFFQSSSLAVKYLHACRGHIHLLYNISVAASSVRFRESAERFILNLYNLISVYSHLAIGMVGSKRLFERLKVR